TKFEWGFDERTGELLLADEVLTPDSSRYWAWNTYRPGGPQPSFDKQFVRDWLETTGWDKASPPPPLPEDVIPRARQKYVEAYERLTGHAFLQEGAPSPDRIDSHAPLLDRRRVPRAGVDGHRRRVPVGRRPRHGDYRPRARAAPGGVRA